MKKVRVRFAPSPTGALHLGGVRTALYDYLFAKNQGGEFVLRIEDTDTARYVEGAEDYIMNSLEWCGIIPDESPKIGGPYAPYRQSERRDIYDRYKEQILKTDYAYLAFDTPEELDSIRKKFEAKGDVFSYNYQTRQQLRNSISLSSEEVQKLLDENVPYVVRFKMPIDRTLNLQDIIRGNFSVNTNTLDDKVLIKNDGMPTYHFANVVDDFEMKISHVIRGEEWLPSMPLHVLLYEAMNWEAPKFAHLSLILKPEGKGKLSKRDGAKFGFPVFPMDFKDPESDEIWKGYKESGYFPEAFINMTALLGWTPANDKEIVSLDEMIAEFDLHKVHKAGARFDPQKAKWFNQEYLKLKSDEEVLLLLKEVDEVKSLNLSDEKLLKIISLMKERANFVADIYNDGKFFFETPTSYDEKALKKAWNETTSAVLKDLSTKLETTEFDSEVLKETIHHFAEEQSLGMGKVMMPLRLALVGELKGPDVPDIMNIIGKEETLARIEKAINSN
ncbi:glutamate--tRNA ligase [Epilithonimonas arachidiradicis]|uniref:Glutamate--tRNA ligase n=1 Tax=Epilithonimonas arachidiradicis TaxID=1617282 RepID=A0A420D7T5_9FLAO|nr:glutamate--tRNA ligase [Epilithonimonas arachidiradicis]RKE86826.1 glutamyl-tRNA synthetase [Epilithonimonas arachidiradicis]GGG61725.1 glutamate--tRNA ligase [Epilithonimonas arachidiradicis]